MTTKKAISLSLSLTDNNFIELGRRKYSEKYTVIPVRAYSEDVKEVIESLYNLVGLELEDENSCLSILASEEGFPQRLIGPKVFQVNGVLNLKIANGLYPISQVQSEDEIKYQLNGKNLVLQAEGKQPVFKLVLKSGVSIKFPVYINKNEQGDYYGVDALDSALNQSDNAELLSQIIGSPSSGTRMALSALKHLPVGTYSVISAKNEIGKYGPALNLVVSSDTELTIAVQERNSTTERWETVESLVPANSPIKVQGNTALKNSLMGSDLTQEDSVKLCVIDQTENKEGKTIVNACFDYSESRLKFEF
jgi:hypothetical protein